MKVLINFRHGLGDVVQLTAVLRHLAYYHPDWEIDVVTDRGKCSALAGLCRSHSEPQPQEGYEKVFSLDWWECDSMHSRHPATKVERCLLDVFKLQPVPELLGYQIRTTADTDARAESYLTSIGATGRAVAIHYQGNTATDRKNLDHGHVEALCSRLLEADLVPIILDWDARSRLPDNRSVFNPGASHPMWSGLGSGDAATLVSLLRRCRCVVAIDSGPQKAAIAAGVPTVCVWRRHHPLNYVVPSPEALHLVPDDVSNHLRGTSAAKAPPYFEAAYNTLVYPYRNAAHERQVELRHWLWTATQDRLHWTPQPRDLAWSALSWRLLKEDLENFAWCPAEEIAAYKARFDLAADLMPKSICEIGVRAGYSAHAFLSGAPGASYQGYDIDGDTHGGVKGAVDHARQLLPQAQIDIADSQAMQSFPREFDLVHVDGDHTYSGCKHDLELALTANPRAIVVDDYLNILPVHQACTDFGSSHPEFRVEVVDDGYKGLCVFHRSK